MIGVDHVKDERLRLPDGRGLGFRVYGDPRGLPVLFLHGTPGSRLKFSIADEAGKALGLGDRRAGPLGLRPDRGTGQLLVERLRR
jgi:hypothetical protein